MDKKKTQKLSRREFLKVGAAGVGVAALGSMPNKVFGQAPAALKGTTLTILQGTYFIAPGQDLYKKQAAEWGQANGVDVRADFLNWPDLQPKIAEVQSPSVERGRCAQESVRSSQDQCDERQQPFVPAQEAHHPAETAGTQVTCVENRKRRTEEPCPLVL